MTRQYLATAGCYVGPIRGVLSNTGGALRASVLVIVMAVATVGQQVPAPETTSQSPTATQVPDAPSATKQSQHGSFGHGVATVVKTIGQDELHLISAPFRIDSFGFADKAPFLNKTLFWDS